MRKTAVLILSFIMMISSISCARNHKYSVDEEGKVENSGKIKIVTETFSSFDWVRNIIGDNLENFELNLLTDKGGDLHSYKPNADDIKKISDADLFIHVGGESDTWVEGAVKTAKNKKLKTLNLLEALGDLALPEESVVGMEADEEGHHDEEGHGHEHNNDEDEDYDEHVWLSLRNAKVFSEKIAELISKIDSKNKEIYAENYRRYASELDKLDEKYKSLTSKVKNDTLVFADRFPFRYMFNDYGLKYFAAFKGCHAESEASFDTVIFLSKKIDELGLGTVMTIENSNKEIAKTVISNTLTKNQEILSLDSLQSVSAKDIEEGKTYLESMNKNLKVLEKALK